MGGSRRRGGEKIAHVTVAGHEEALSMLFQLQRLDSPSSSTPTSYIATYLEADKDIESQARESNDSSGLEKTEDIVK